MLKWIVKKQDGRTCNRLPWLRIGQEAGCCKNGNRTKNSMKCVEFFYLPWTTNLEFERWLYIKGMQQFSDGGVGNVK